MTILEFATNIKNKISARLTEINAALVKKGQAECTDMSEVPAKIEAIETGADVSGVTATAGDVLSPKVFVDANGNPIMGTIATKTSGNLSVSGATVTVPAGYYASQVDKSVSTAAQATPSISVNSSGLITALSTQSTGYVVGDTKKATKQLTTKGATEWTPSIDKQTISSGTYLTGTQTIKGDSNLVPDNIKSGVSIFGVAGKLSSGGVLISEKISMSGESDTISLTVPSAQKGVEPKYAVVTCSGNQSGGEGIITLFLNRQELSADSGIYGIINALYNDDQIRSYSITLGDNVRYLYSGNTTSIQYTGTVANVYFRDCRYFVMYIYA